MEQINDIVLVNCSTEDIYLNYSAKTVIKTKQITDYSCGMFPCYYIKENNYLKVSSSVIALIKDNQKFELNSDFNPNYKKHGYWQSSETIDKRIFKLKAFEEKTVLGSTTVFFPKRYNIEKDEFLNKSIKMFKKWINYIELKFPDYEHVVYTGGRDSRIIHLLSKLNPEKWHIFSSYPNAVLLKEWLNYNEINHNLFFTHDNVNDDKEEYLIKKIECSDYQCRPSDIRWARTADGISKLFNKKCIFWLGNAGDTLYACRDASFQANNYKNYFEKQYIQTSGLQGTYHQMVFNLTNCPIISLYSYSDLWIKLYQNFNPSIFKNQDLRPELGNKIIGRKLKWFGDDSQLVPKAWELSNEVIDGLLNRYVNKIEK